MPLRAEFTFGAAASKVGYWVRQGDIITLFGAFYRVSKISPEPRNVECTKLPIHMIPKGLSVEPDSIILPFRATTKIHNRDVWWDAVVEGEQGEPAKARIYHIGVVRRAVEGRGTIIVPQLHPDHSKVVGVGDDFTIYGGKSNSEDPYSGVRTHVIRRIVPPDPKRKIAGWIEIDPHFERK